MNLTTKSHRRHPGRRMLIWAIIAGPLGYSVGRAELHANSGMAPVLAGVAVAALVVVAGVMLWRRGQAS